MTNFRLQLKLTPKWPRGTPQCDVQLHDEMKNVIQTIGLLAYTCRQCV